MCIIVECYLLCWWLCLQRGDWWWCVPLRRRRICVCERCTKDTDSSGIRRPIAAGAAEERLWPRESPSAAGVCRPGRAVEVVPLSARTGSSSGWTGNRRAPSILFPVIHSNSLVSFVILSLSMNYISSNIKYLLWFTIHLMLLNNN